MKNNHYLAPTALLDDFDHLFSVVIQPQVRPVFRFFQEERSENYTHFRLGSYPMHLIVMDRIVMQNVIDADGFLPRSEGDGFDRSGLKSKSE
jgi:hypothetical protein